MFSPDVEMAFERALAAAKARSAAALTTEQVVIELLDEETVAELLSSASVDVNALRADLKGHLGPVAENVGEKPKPDQPLQNAMQRAVMKSLTSNKKGAVGADLIVAILVEGDSYSAEMLQKYGLSVESVENVNLERYLKRSKDGAKRRAEMQEKARTQRERTVGSISTDTKTRLAVRSKPEGHGTRQKDDGHKTYILRIVSDDDESDRITFKAALSRNGILDLYVEETPFEIEFVASTIVGLFEAVEGGDRLKVQLITETDGQQKSVSGFSGSAGAIFEDRHNWPRQQSGVLD